MDCGISAEPTDLLSRRKRKVGLVGRYLYYRIQQSIAVIRKTVDLLGALGTLLMSARSLLEIASDSLGVLSLTGLKTSSAHPPLFPPVLVLDTMPCTSYTLSFVVNTTQAFFFPFLSVSAQNPNATPVIGC